MQFDQLGRRGFITLIGGTAATWPFAARAQQGERIRRVGVLMGVAETDPAAPARIAGFKQKLAQLGWTENGNVRIDVRWTASDINTALAQAKELVGLQSDVIVAHTLTPARAARDATRTIPIVFTNISDPNGGGLVQSVSRPGGNITGFSNLEPTIGAKLLEILHEIAPRVTRLAVVFNRDISTFAAPFARSAQGAASNFLIAVTAVPVHDPAELKSVIAMLGQEPGGGLLLPPDSFTATHRDIIIKLAAQYKLPAIYVYRYFVDEGGLVSYGTNPVDSFAQSATYVDRILRGAKPGELPIQAPVKFELVINFKTSRALGLEVPPSLLALADEVIE
jgi:putative ABC transport system substrate-binding protein